MKPLQLPPSSLHHPHKLSTFYPKSQPRASCPVSPPVFFQKNLAQEIMFCLPKSIPNLHTLTPCCVSVSKSRYVLLMKRSMKAVAEKGMRRFYMGYIKPLYPLLSFLHNLHELSTFYPKCREKTACLASSPLFLYNSTAKYSTPRSPNPISDSRTSILCCFPFPKVHNRHYMSRAQLPL